MAYEVNISGKSTILVNEGDSILESALEQGIEFPHGCRSGNCGACKTKLLSGKVDMMPYSEFAIEEQELKNNFILACRALPQNNCKIEIANNSEKKIRQDIKQIKYRALDINKVTEEIISLRLENTSNEQFNFLAGQYAELQFDSLEPRQFSMANCPSDKNLEFHIKKQLDGKVSNYIFNKLKLGEELFIKGPYGDSYLRDNHRGPILGVAGGTGLAPILSISLSSYKKKMKQPIYIYIGAKKEEEFYYLEKFMKIKNKNPNFSFFPIISDQKSSRKYRTGLVTDAVMEDIEDFDGFKVYLAGPPPMVEAAENLFPNLGLDNKNIHADAFYTSYEEERKNG